MTDLNSNWFQFLQQQGACFADAPGTDVLNFGADPALLGSSVDFLAPLTDLGLIESSGEEAGHFLHNQLTNDVEHLASTEARLAGYCSPKGRLLATFLIWKSSDKLMLQLPCEIQQSVQNRLRMFVLRAKAKLTDVTADYALLGLAGPAATAALERWFPNLPAEPYAKAESDAGTLIRVADASGAARYQWIMGTELAQQVWPILIKTLQPVGAAAWRLANIRAAIPQITLATQERFVPQMLNYEVVGGLSFKKGCYPGQEIVARSQYLGKPKRRMMLASVTSLDAKAGMEVFSASDPEQTCGMIVNAEPSSPEEMDCLVEIRVAALGVGTINLGLADGPALNFRPLPYPLPDAA
jgi:folate-binding protein YgfZ